MSGFPPLLALVRAASLVRLTCHRVYTFCVSTHPSVDTWLCPPLGLSRLCFWEQLCTGSDVFAPVGTSMGGGAAWDSPSVLGPPWATLCFLLVPSAALLSFSVTQFFYLSAVIGKLF